VKLRLWSESHRLIVTAAGCVANGQFTVAANQCVTGFIWPRLWRRTTTRSYAIFICDCELLANQPNWLSPLPCESC
jgi:hypothetical protein